MITISKTNDVIPLSPKTKLVSHSVFYRKNLLNASLIHEEDKVINNLISMGYKLCDHDVDLSLDQLIRYTVSKDKKHMCYLLLNLAQCPTTTVYDLHKATQDTIFCTPIQEVVDYYNVVTESWMYNTNRVSKSSNILTCNKNIGTVLPSINLYAFVKYTLSLYLLPTDNLHDSKLYDMLVRNLAKVNNVLKQQGTKPMEVLTNEVKAIHCSRETFSENRVEVEKRE